MKTWAILTSHYENVNRGTVVRIVEELDEELAIVAIPSTDTKSIIPPVELRIQVHTADLDVITTMPYAKARTYQDFTDGLNWR